jgi:hypothetical protein
MINCYKNIKGKYTQVPVFPVVIELYAKTLERFGAIDRPARPEWLAGKQSPFPAERTDCIAPKALQDQRPLRTSQKFFPGKASPALSI